MNILAMEPYYGGSHRAFIDGWISRSRHNWTLLTASAHGWKWRMRHAAVGFARDARLLRETGRRWDLVFCTDMMNLAEFCGLVPPAVAALPRVVYFHENQFTYPVGADDRWDAHFGLSNMAAALAADAAWWNSAFNRDDFLAALAAFLKKMRRPRLTWAAGAIAAVSRVAYPGVDLPAPRPRREPGPLRIAWTARWEHDKSPETFFAAVEQLAEEGGDFRLIVTGPQFRARPDVFDEAARRLRPHIDHWGFIPDRREYLAALGRADVAVSTAAHEFFGIAMIEAAAAGAFPLVPDRLAYPEVFGPPDRPDRRAFFYAGDAGDLARRLAALAADCAAGRPPSRDARRTANLDRFDWAARAPALDDALEDIAAQKGNP